MHKRVGFMVFLGIASALVLATGISAGAAPRDDSRAGHGEVASAQDRLAEIRTRASASYETYNNALFQLNELDDEIEATSRNLEAAEGNLAEAQASLEERASQVYKSGNVAFLDVLVGVDDFSEFASRLNLWLRLLGQERAEFRAVLEARNELEDEQSRLQDQRDQRAAAVEDAAAQKERADNAEVEARAYLDSLNAELQAAIEEEQARQAEEARAAAEAAEEVEMVQVAQVQPADAPADGTEVEARTAPVAAPASEPVDVRSHLREERELAEQRAAERAEQQAAAEAAAAEAERQAQLAEQQAAEEKAAERAAAEQAAAERRATAEEARQAAEQAAVEQAAAELEAQQAAAEQAAAEQAEQAAAEQQAAAQQVQQQPVAQPVANNGTETSPEPAPSSGGSASGAAVVAEAETWLGTPYVWGGTSRSGVDCSGLTMMVYAQFGVSLPRTTGEQFGVGTPVSSPAPGDLVFFGGGGGITSVGIVTGPDTAIKATVPGDVVRYVSISEVGNATGGVAGYRRVL